MWLQCETMLRVCDVDHSICLGRNNDFKQSITSKHSHVYRIFSISIDKSIHLYELREWSLSHFDTSTFLKENLKKS